jgi:hypothetical protein
MAEFVSPLCRPLTFDFVASRRATRQLHDEAEAD